MRKFLSSSSEAVTQSATHIMRQAKAAALANAIKESQQLRSPAIIVNNTAPANAPSSASTTVQSRPLVGISSPQNRARTVPAAAYSFSASSSSSSSSSSTKATQAAQEKLYQVQKPLSAAELYRQARISGLITPTIAINEFGAESTQSNSNSGNSSSSQGATLAASLPHYTFYAILLSLTGCAAWLCLDHTPLHSTESQALLQANFSKLHRKVFEVVSSSASMTGKLSQPGSSGSSTALIGTSGSISSSSSSSSASHNVSMMSDAYTISSTDSISSGSSSGSSAFASMMPMDSVYASGSERASECDACSAGASGASASASASSCGVEGTEERTWVGWAASWFQVLQE